MADVSAAEGSAVADAGEGGLEPCISNSMCLLLKPDGAEEGGSVLSVMFKRDERGEASIDDTAADLLGIRDERVRCMHVPRIEKLLGVTLHMYYDVDALQHGLPHNTNATQLYLIANLPDEPPEVSPASIHGPVLLSATNFKTEEYQDLTVEDWQKMKSVCRAVQPNAQFVPYEAPRADDAEGGRNDD